MALTNLKIRQEKNEASKRKCQMSVKMFSVIELTPSLMSRKFQSNLKSFADVKTRGRSSDG